MKQKSILFPCLLLAASVYAWLESGQAELFSGQDQWPVLLMLLGATFVYQGKKKPLHPIFYRFASLRDRFTLFCQAEMGMVAG